MIGNYYTLASVIREANQWLTSQSEHGGARFESAYSFRPAELRLRFSGGFTLVAILHPTQGTLFLTKRAESLPKKNVISFFPELHGEELKEIRIAEHDRIIRLDFGLHCLKLTFFSNPNATLYKGGSLISSFRKNKEIAAEDVAGVRSALSTLGKRLTKEYEFRKGIGDEAKFLDELQRSHSSVVYKVADSVLYSPVDLKNIESSGAPIEKVRFESPSEGIRFVITERHRLQAWILRKRTFLASLEAAITREKLIAAEIASALANPGKAESLQSIAQGILGTMHEIKPSDTEIILHLATGTIQIPIDAEAKPAQIAEQYFNRAKRARESLVHLKQRALLLENRAEALSRLLDSSVSIENMKELEALEADSRKIMRTSIRQAQTHEPSGGSTFREFVVFGGIRLLVGKSALQNDELTMHIAKKNDIWLHARGVKGSHAVLQIAGAKNGVIPKEAIEEAASIAAYFSDAKSQSIAPVSYTEAKYVRKPRNANPGAVLMQREEVVMVKPGLPKSVRA